MLGRGWKKKERIDRNEESRIPRAQYVVISTLKKSLTVPYPLEIHEKVPQCSTLDFPASTLLT
jgi:hypothetical protein